MNAELNCVSKRKSGMGVFTALLIISLGIASLAFGSRAKPAYRAICADHMHGTQGWFGPQRATYAEAKADAKSHATAFGHSTDVIDWSTAAEGTVNPCGADVAASDTCKFVAEISVEAVRQGAFAICIRTGHPVACAVASAAEDVAAREVAKTGVEAGCNWTVKKISGTLLLQVHTNRQNAEDLAGAHDSLKLVKELRWLQYQK